MTSYLVNFIIEQHGVYRAARIRSPFATRACMEIGVHGAEAGPRFERVLGRIC